MKTTGTASPIRSMINCSVPTATKKRSKKAKPHATWKSAHELCGNCLGACAWRNYDYSTYRTNMPMNENLLHHESVFFFLYTIVRHGLNCLHRHPNGSFCPPSQLKLFLGKIVKKAQRGVEREWINTSTINQNWLFRNPHFRVCSMSLQ